MKFLENIIDENDEDGGWVDTHFFNDSKELNEEIIVGEEATEQSFLSKPTEIAVTTSNTDDDDDSEAEDIENYMGQPKLDDEDDEVEKKTVLKFDMI